MVPLPEIFEDTEAEAKFIVPDLRTFEHMRALAGRKVDKWNLFFRYESLFVDQYYDDAEFSLNGSDQVLRARRRYRDSIGIEPRDARLQRKGPTEIVGPVFFRREVRGDKVKQRSAWDEFISAELMPGSRTREDFEAELGGNPDSVLKPVVEIRDIRHRLYFEKDKVLKFEMSLDRLQAVRSDEPESFVFGYECEVESIADNNPETLEMLLGLSESLSDQFGLQPSPGSKYRRALDALLPNANGTGG